MKAKIQVITLFFTGLSYDQISRETGVSKGGVVNIIDDYREGRLALSGNMTECVDELRRVAVDLRKHQTTVAHLISYLKIHAKLKEMGVDGNSLEQWIEICRDISSPDLSGKQFVATALELARMESQTGLTYQEIINDYNDKLARSKELDEEIEEKQEQLEEADLRYERQERQARTQLDSITAAIATAQDNFHKQKDGLKSQLDEYRAQNNLSWKKVNTAVALFSSELSKVGFTQKDLDQLAEKIRNTGSLLIYIGQLENTRDSIRREIEQLKRTIDDYNTCVNSLKRSFDELAQNNHELYQSKSEIEVKISKLEEQIESKREELGTLVLTMDECKHNFHITELIIGLLSNPDLLSEYNLEQLVGLMIAIRQKRKDIGPVWRIDNHGNPVCECVVPEMYKNSVYIPGVDIDHVRELLATYLFPIVKDKFITRHAHELAMNQSKQEHEMATVLAKLDVLQRLGRRW